MWVQSGCLAVVLVAVALTRASEWAVGMGLGLSAWWLLLNMLYASALVDPEGPEDCWRDRSAQRRGGDRHVARQAVLIISVTILATLTTLLAADGLLPDNSAFVVCVTIVAGIGWVNYASSLIDWYYVLPRVDGLVREPPCRTSQDVMWFKVTRIW
jgi:hypothetical protein